MKVIAWNQANDTAIDPERTPNEGEWCNHINGSKSKKCQYVIPVTPVAITPDKLVPIGVLIGVFPTSTTRELKVIRDTADYNDPTKAVDGDTAEKVLSYLQIGDPINANSTAFDILAIWLIEKTSVTQGNIDTIKAWE